METIKEFNFPLFQLRKFISSDLYLHMIPLLEKEILKYYQNETRKVPNKREKNYIASLLSFCDNPLFL